MDNAKELLISMIDAGFSPSYCTYSWVIDGYCELNDEGAILRLLDDFEGRGLCIGLSVCRALIRRFCKRERIASAERASSLMQEKGISGDSIIYTSLAYAYLKGDVKSSSALLDDMYNKRLMITLKIYRSFNASYAGESHILRLFWDNLVGRGLISKAILKDIEQSDLLL
ncbi:hypothetical protein CDL15_Pgr001616 [Punica granatum]|uniref:Uncharacterized protein n=1 Tax=Punica granatum TaxID=22663 RepID=A0A218XCF4_PUNGR|nr:hypothetical protein CDL15_Pgr001616 [Punica granatum]